MRRCAISARELKKMKNKLKMPTRLTESMVVVSMGFGAIYWIIDTLFYILTSDVSSVAPLFHLNPRDIGCV